jgi:cell division septation protein DedD
MALPIRLRTLTAAVVVIASGLTIFYSYQSIINSTDDGLQALPIIRADKEPFRVVPDEPGGAKIPNQGSKLFEVLDANHPDDLALDGVKIDVQDSEPLTILDEAADADEMTGFEIPVVPEKRTESLYGMIDDLKDTKDIVEEPMVAPLTVEKTVEIVEVKLPEKKIEIVKVVDEKEPVVGTVAIIRPLIKPKTPQKKKVESKAVESNKSFSLDRILKETPIKKRHYIQLASLKSKDEAEKFYNRIREQFPKLVSGINVFYPQADLGTRGTFTRVQVGPLDQAAAKSRCADYSSSARGGTCLVISR